MKHWLRFMRYEIRFEIFNDRQLPSQMNISSSSQQFNT